MTKLTPTVNSELVTLVRRAQAGDTDAYADLFNRFHQPLLGYIFHTLHDRQAAEDVVQEAFIRAHDNLAKLGPPFDFKSWLYRIASNLAIDHIRGSKRIVDVEDDVMAYLDDPPSTRRPFEKRISRQEIRDQVWSSLAGVPTRYRQALLLREFNDLSYHEVAEALEVSYDNARQLVHRGRTMFREQHGLRMATAAARRCRELAGMLSAYQDGELEPEQVQVVRTHLETCDHCQQEKRHYERIAGLIAGLAPFSPADAWRGELLRRLRDKQLAPKASAESPAAAEPAGSPAPQPAPSPSDGLAGMNLTQIALYLVGGMVVLGLVGAGVALAMGGPPPAGAPAPTATEAGTALAGEAATGFPASASDETPTAALEPPAATETASPTATLGPAMATALEDSTCRGGPSAEKFPATAFLLQGVTVPIDGRSQEDTYWWVMQPDGTGHCYIWKQLVQAEGDLASVPTIPDPEPPDQTAPTVQVAHAPSGSQRPTSSEPVSFTATADDEGGIAVIEIWLQGPNENAPQLVRSCPDTTTCEYKPGSLQVGNYSYYAVARDNAGNEEQTTTQSLVIWPGLF